MSRLNKITYEDCFEFGEKDVEELMEFLTDNGVKVFITRNNKGKITILEVIKELKGVDKKC
jgi:hypothetical protein